MKKGFIKEIEDFELHQKLIYFLGVVILTIIITRLLIFFIDVNPIIKGYELHHFYYGIILLIISTILMITIHLHFRVYIFLTAVSMGLIADEFIYIIGGAGNQEKYFSTLPSAVIFTLLIITISLIIRYFSRKKN